MADFRVIPTTVISSVTQVHLYDETIEHAEQNHPEIPVRFPMIIAAVEKTIQNPTHIEPGKRGSLVFVDAESTNLSGDPLKVPVKLIEGTSGRVQTFFFGSNSVAPNQYLWRRNDDDSK